MTNLTDLDKKIYNSYLKYLRFGQPYKVRKNFDDLDPKTVVSLKKISNFLTTYNHIDCDDYFQAFRSVYPNDKYPPLEHFFSRSALKNYSLFKKQQEDKNPEMQFDKIKDSMRFIGMFCIKNNIAIDQYLDHKQGYMYSWMNHYREHRINPYCLFIFRNFFETLNSIPQDELSLFGSNLKENIIAFYDRYNKSKTTKDFINEIFTKVKFFVQKELTEQK